MLDTKIRNTINYHTNRTSKVCKLDSALADDVRQELTLTALDDHAANPDLALDVQAVLEKLSSRHRSVCELLMAGYTQEEIGKKLTVSQQRIDQIVAQIRKISKESEIAPC